MCAGNFHLWEGDMNFNGQVAHWSDNIFQDVVEPF